MIAGVAVLISALAVVNADNHATITRHVARQAPTGSPKPLTDYTFAYTDLPYQINPFPVERGPQSGYNICNSTTGGPNSNCQTLIFNNISDFCLWGSPTLDASGTVGDTEAAAVVYCTTDKHGTRLLPEGSITGLQFTRTPSYIQIVGFLKNEALNFKADDTGGEMDPHGADLFGNPLGGVVYSNNMPNGDGKSLQQVIEWNNFLGNNYFCFKACIDSKNPRYCQNKFDRIGCKYNMPSAAKDGEFTECDAELQDVVGVYTVDGKVTTYAQPPEGQEIATLPYEPRIPASSNCKTYSSAQLFAAATTAPASSATTTPPPGSSSSSSGGSSAPAAAQTSNNGGGAAAGLVAPALSALLVLCGGIWLLA